MALGCSYKIYRYRGFLVLTYAFVDIIAVKTLSALALVTDASDTQTYIIIYSK